VDSTGDTKAANIERIPSRPHMKSAIIIGASSGIGRALAVALSLDGYRVGVAARRTDLLARLQAELTGPCVIKTVDVSQPDCMPLLRELIEEAM
jgi:NADP-dependent 3-hydroxy acid dehydrogenase YdfG